MEPNMEEIEKRADDYASRYVERFHDVARKAFIDGIMVVLNDLMKV